MGITRNQFKNLLKRIKNVLSPTIWEKGAILKNHKVYLKVNRLSDDPKYEYDPYTDPYVVSVDLNVGAIILSNGFQVRFESIFYSKSLEELRSKFYIVSDL